MSILGEFIDERDMIIGELVMGENHLFSLLMDGQTFSKWYHSSISRLNIFELLLYHE